MATDRDARRPSGDDDERRFEEWWTSERAWRARRRGGVIQFDGDLIEVLRIIADLLEKERAKVCQMHDDALEIAALQADQVGAKASPGDGKETADEIGRRIRALMQETR